MSAPIPGGTLRITDGRKAYVRRVDSISFTDAIDYTHVKNWTIDSNGVGRREAAHGEVRLNRQIVGFKNGEVLYEGNVVAGNAFRFPNRNAPPRSGCTSRKLFWLDAQIYADC